MSRNKLIKYNHIENCPDILEFYYHFPDEIGADWLKRVNPHNLPIILEVGCGYGEYVRALAASDQVHVYIGIDIKGDRLWYGYRKVSEACLSNCYFIRSQIDHIIRIFAEEIIDEIWVTFPDPQPKHAKRRLISPKYLALYHTLLKPSGSLILKTDSRLVYEYGNKTMNENGFVICTNIVNLDINPHVNPIVNSVRSRYELQFRNKGHIISYIQAKKV